MSIAVKDILEALRVRVRPESPQIIASIDALRDAERFLVLDDRRNCIVSLEIAASALAKEGESKAESASGKPGRSTLLKKYRDLARACRAQLRESAQWEQPFALNKYVAIACAAFVAIVAIAVGLPYIYAGGKISSVRTQVYWVHFPKGMSESRSRYSPITLDGEWREIKVNASAPLTAVRIDPATDATVLDYYDIRNAQVTWQDPEPGFAPELQQVHWRGYGCTATNEDGYLSITAMEPDCNVTSMNFPAYYEVTYITFEARAESRKLGVWQWLAWTLGWRSINE